ncbi:MAG: Holliday junction resolvase RuvX [Oscillospiraceae bacterium]|jgi:putative Holliday junction resolvase|nr:Holliday junction resolvase RuvX [Oscillospiraceae bacterium]
MKIMAVDLGDARTGLAVCDRTETLASPVGVIKEYNIKKTLEKVLAAAQEFEARMIVIGLPRNMDGSEGIRAAKSREFALNLKMRTELPIELWDERQSTVLASRYLSDANVDSRRQRGIIDEAAAAVILQSYLDYRKNSGTA